MKQHQKRSATTTTKRSLATTTTPHRTTTRPKPPSKQPKAFKTTPKTQQRAQFATFDFVPDYDPTSVTVGPDPVQVRSIMRQLLRNSNPRIQSMRPRRSIRLSNGYNAIVNEYKVKMSCGIVEAWKAHATASQLVQALKANTYNANTLYQSGWKPARPQKQQIDSVARQIGLGLNTNGDSDELDRILNPTQANLEEMLLFSNKSKIRIDPKTDTHQQILGDDSVFMDIFGSSEPPADIKKVLGSAKVDTSGIDDALQRALFEDLGFDENESSQSEESSEAGEAFFYEETDLQGFPIMINANRQRLRGVNGWEVPAKKLTTVFQAPTDPTTSSNSWDSAMAFADGSLNFARSFVISMVNGMQHNEDVYGLGLQACLLNDVHNISHPRTTDAFFAGVANFTPTVNHKM